VELHLHLHFNASVECYRAIDGQCRTKTITNGGEGKEGGQVESVGESLSLLTALALKAKSREKRKWPAGKGSQMAINSSTNQVIVQPLN